MRTRRAWIGAALMVVATHTAGALPDSLALRHRGASMTYGELATKVLACASGFLNLGLERQERVAIFLPKQFEAVVAMFGAAQAGLVFVPINPILKQAQVEHILRDCNVRKSTGYGITLRPALRNVPTARDM